MEMYNYDSLAEAIKQPISSEARFYTVEDIVKMTGWSHNTVLKLFNDPQFPAADFGRAKVVESHALIEYFSKRRSKQAEKFWVRGDKYEAIKRRLG